MAIQILAPTTEAANSSPFVCTGRDPVSVHMHAASGLTAAEYGQIQISHDDGTTWASLYDYDTGALARLDDTHNVIVISGAGLYRVAKDATTNAAGISISRHGAL